MLRKTIVALAAWLASGVALSAGAATLLDTSEVVAANAEAAAQLPPSYEFTLTVAGDYVVTLRELPGLGAPENGAALQSLRALVTRDLQAVAELEIEYSSSPGVAPLPKTQTFAGTPGTYRVHVLGAVKPDEAGGLFSVDVTPAAGGAAVFSVADEISIPGAPAPSQSVLQTTFTANVAGTYRVRALDRSFPAALVSRDVLVLRRSPQLAVMVDSSGAFSTGDVGTFSAQAGDSFELVVIATAGSELAGLYGLIVQGGPSDAVIYRSENAVGRLPPARAVNVTSTATHTLTLADLQFPAPLTAYSAAVIQNDAFVGAVTGATPGNLALTAGAAQLFIYSTAATTGALSASLSNGSQVVYSDVHMTDASADATTPAIYSFSPTATVAAGTYTLTLEDLRFPTELPELQVAVVQGGVLVDRLDEAASDSVTLQDGNVRVLIAATPPPVSGTLPGNGAFVLSLKAQSGASVFESTQGVGGLFKARKINLPAAGRYDIALKDFEFPERLRISWLAVTRGTTLVGQVIGSSSIQNLQLEAGEHVLNFIGQPAANASYGTFGLKVADAAPAPVVTLSASPTSVTAGQRASLQWSATNAASCTAAGGWSGNKALSGTEQTAALTANTTYEIECVGPGGRGTASVTVAVTAASSRGGGGGGGGHMDPLWLVALLGLLAAARVRQRRTVM